MDVPRKSARKQKIIKRIIGGVVTVAAALALTIWLRGLKPAAPTVEASTVWRDTVRRGPMVRDVRGLGTLVPEDTLLLPAMTDGRVARIYIRPGTPVKANDVIMVLENPDLQTELLDKEYALKAAEAAYTDLRVTLEKQVLDLRSTAAQVSADYHSARLKADRDSALAKEGLVADVDAKISVVNAQELATRNDIEERRLKINTESVDAQLAKAKVAVEQARAAYELKQKQVEALKVRPGVDGMLQALPTPVEEGQKVLAGTPLGKVSQPSKLKAVLKIAETQVKDVAIGQPAVVDTRNGLVNGHVSRIDPSIINGTVDVDVKLDGPLPQGARPDLSVDGTIQLEKLSDVVYVGRPVFGQAESTVTLFKLEPDGRYANRVQVKLGRASVNTIEIREGLRVGDVVILSDMSAWDGYDRIRLN
ncbi:MAG TPA: HlyD family efflux transporter periplasmic adaptor subunit [Bryobacteraceae bacterium]|nr:HlyD family efflux transporter periplasmic adaptor subunit [Bryobacteraceae bacterium]